MTIQALPYILLLGVLFGSTLIASRFSVGQFHPTTYIGLRLVMASLGHLAIYAFVGQYKWPTDRRLWRHATILGIFGTAIPMTAIVAALLYQSSGVTSLLITTNPALTVLLAHFLLADERLTVRKSLGILLALGGAALLAARGETGLSDMGAVNPIGYLLVLIAIIASSSMTIYARKYMSDLDSFDVASVRMFVAALVVVPLSLLFVGFDLQAVTTQGYFALGYAALIGTFSGFILSFYIIKRFGATPSAMTAYVIPIVAGVGGMLILDETISRTMLVGMGLIISGIALINQRK